MEQIKTILFVYQQIFDFPGYNQEINVFISKKFLNSVLNLLHSEVVLHHLHITGKIIGYSHDFCNLKVIENKKNNLGFCTQSF